MEVEAVDEGRLGKILVPEGAEGIKVNETIALLLEAGEDSSALRSAPAKSALAEKAPAKEAPDKEAPDKEAPAEEAPALEAVPRRSLAAVGAPASPARLAPAERAGARIFASPLARRMAQEAGLELSGITPSGPQGRIVKADVEAALLARQAPAEAAPAAPAAQAPPTREAALPPPALSKARVVALAGNPPYREEAVTQMRRVIARRLSESKQTIPHFYVTVDCEIDALLKIRAELNAKSEAYKITLNDFVIRAAALALRRVPEANASWSDEAILLWDSVDIAVAVALDGGLITPIIKAADRKGLLAIAREMRDLGARAREGKLKLQEFQGGTFSVSNLGMYGVREFAAVINSPHGAILAVGAGEKRPLVRDGAVAVATVMTATLSCDHRVVDGVTAARFLAAFKGFVEDPLTMLL
jgi:pyruvate dehydrogenase E2 component (dihydrolipoamide acetyltransferase)